MHAPTKLFSSRGRGSRLWWPAGIVLAASIIALTVMRGLAPPAPQTLRLADGTQLYFYTRARIRTVATFPQRREVGVDGDIFIKAPAGARPLIVRSRLLVLTVTGDAAFRITAHSAETGEQVEVLRGNVVAQKNYRSTYEQPDALVAGQMVMVNRTIDLMEKETFDPSQLRTWSEALTQSARPFTGRE